MANYKLHRLDSNKTASFIVLAKPLSSTSRGSSAGSSNLGTSFYPAHKERDLGEVVLAETMNEAKKNLDLLADKKNLCPRKALGHKMTKEAFILQYKKNCRAWR